MFDGTRIRGIVVPMLTPLLEDGVTVHERGVHQLVERLIDQGVHGVFVGGTTGEVWTLDDEQWQRLVRFAREAVQGRVPLYVGVSHHSTAAAVARAQSAEKLGADVIISLAPYYIAPSQADIIRHFRTLAAASDLPLIVYQYPGIVKTSITLPTYVELMQISGIVGVKDSQANVTEFYNMIRLLRSGGQDCRLLLGTDELTSLAIMMGGQGTVPSFGNVVAPYLVEAYEAAVAGQWERSAAATAKVSAVKQISKVAGADESQGTFLATLKCAASLLGIEVGAPAAPVRPCNVAETQAVAEILHSNGLL